MGFIFGTNNNDYLRHYINEQFWNKNLIHNYHILYNKHVGKYLKKLSDRSVLHHDHD